jgi:hypothetical protein
LFLPTICHVEGTDERDDRFHRQRMIAEILLAASLATAPPAGFCSVGFVRDSDAPVDEDSIRRWSGRAASTPNDFVRTTPVIVRATAIRQVSGRPGEAGRNAAGNSVTFRVTEVLKGGEAPDSLRFPGFIDPRHHFNRGPVPYVRGREDPGGGCQARNYRAGAEYLLFLMRGDAGLVLYHSISRPVNEQLRGPDDPWLRWVRGQVAGDTVLTPGPGSPERRAILDALRAEMRRFDRRPVEFVVRHLRVQSGWAWLAADPQSPGGRSRYEREAALLVRRAGRWQVVARMPAAGEREGTPLERDCAWFADLLTRFRSVPRAVLPAAGRAACPR